MYAFLGLLILLLLYHIQDREGLTIHIEGDMDVVTPVQQSIQAVAHGIHGSILRPVYSTMMGFIPYKHHYRRVRRYFRN
jgi:hypothetical protein